MSKKCKYDIFDKNLKYNDYSIQFKLKGDKTIFTNKGYENVYIVDINIKNNGKNNDFYDYYIKIGTNEINDELLAKRVIQKLHNITFDNNKFIGEIRKNSISNNKLISSNLITEEQQKIESNIYNIYKEYLNLKNSDDKNTYLKYVTFLEVYFSTHVIPNVIKKEYIKHVKEKIFDYNILEDIIINEFSGNTHLFNIRTQEIKDNLKKLNNLNKQLLSLQIRTKACREVISKINDYIIRKEESEKKIEEIKQLKSYKKNISIFKIAQRNKIKLNIKEITQSYNFDLEKELKDIKIFIRQKTAAHIIESFKNMTVDEMRDVINDYYKEKQKEKRKVTKELNGIKMHEKKYNLNLDFENMKEYINGLSFDDLHDQIYEKQTQ